jgi:hypothetical protein
MNGRKHLRLVRVGKRAKNASGASIIYRALPSSNAFSLESLDLGPVHSHKKHACYEGAENLREDIVWDFPPGKALPDSKGDRDCGIEMSTGS